jgi:hypothetical protein
MRRYTKKAVCRILLKSSLICSIRLLNFHQTSLELLKYLFTFSPRRKIHQAFHHAFHPPFKLRTTPPQSSVTFSPEISLLSPRLLIKSPLA